MAVQFQSNAVNIVGYARTNVLGSRTLFVIASVHSSIHWNTCI